MASSSNNFINKYVAPKPAPLPQSRATPAPNGSQKFIDKYFAPRDNTIKTIVKTYTPSRGGGGGGSSGGSSSGGSSVSNQQVSQIQASAKQEQVQQQISSNQQIIKNTQIATAFGLASKIPQRSSFQDEFFNPVNIANRNIAKLENQRKSVATPTSTQIDIASKSGRVSVGTATYAQQAVSRDVIQKDYTTNANYESEKINKVVTSGYANDRALIENKATENFNYWQTQVDNGMAIEKAKAGYDKYLEDLNKLDKTNQDKWNKAGTESFKQFNKDYFDTKGANLQKSEALRVERKYVDYTHTQTGRDIKKNFLVGAGIGAVASGVSITTAKVVGQKIATPVTFGLFGANELRKGNYVGAGLNVGLGGLSLLKKAQYAGTPLFIIGGTAINVLNPTKSNPVYQGYKEYKTFRSLGASKGESILYGADIGAGSFLKGEAGLLGAVAGGKAVEMGYTKFNSFQAVKNQKLIQEGFKKNPDVIKTIPDKGYVIEKDIAVKNLKTGQTVVVKAGTIVRQEKIVLDTTGQRKEVINALNKLKPSGQNSIITTIDNKGNVVQISEASISLRKGLFKPLKDTEVFSVIRGTVNPKGQITGVKVTSTTDVSKSTMQHLVDFKGSPLSNPKLQDVSLSRINTKGQVKYAKSDKGIFRGEQSKTAEVMVRRDVFDKNGLWIKSDIAPEQSLGKGAYISKLKATSTTTPRQSGDIAVAGRGSIFKDVVGVTSVKRYKSFFKFEKAPSTSSKAFRIIEEPKTTFTSTTPKPEPFINPPKTTITEIKPSYVNGGQRTSTQSLFKYDKNYVFEDTVTAGGQLSVVPDNSATQKLGQQIMSLTNARVNEKYTGLLTGNLLVPEYRNVIKPEVILIKPSKSLIDIKLQSQIFNAKTIYAPASTGRIGTSSIMSLTQIQQPQLKQPVIEQPIQQPELIRSPIFSPRPNIPFKEFTPVFGLPFMGDIAVGGGQKGARQRLNPYGKTTYNPSLGAVLLNMKKKKVTSKEYTLLSNKKYSGLGLRPEVEIVNSKKKRKGLFS